MISHMTIITLYFTLTISMIMSLVEAALKVKHDCPFCNFSAELPDIKIFSWCNGEHDVMELMLDHLEEYPDIAQRPSFFRKVV